MHGDLRECNDEYVLPLCKKAKIIVLSSYVVSTSFVIISLIFLVCSFITQRSIAIYSDTMALVDAEIECLDESIIKISEERVQAEEIINWIHSSISIQSLIVEILEFMPSELKIKSLSTELIDNQKKMELIIDVIGKKNESLIFSKKVENLLNSKGYKSVSNANLELVSGNRIIINSIFS